jgi:putative ABC transport system substrate-binding protein
VTPRTPFLTVLLFAVIAASSPADAQQVRGIAKVGGLVSNDQPGAAHFLEGFKDGLQMLGYAEGKNLALEIRYAEGKSERLPDLARELVSLKPDVIVASSDLAIAATKRETRTIPIVMVFSVDPVGTGFVASFARPGGQITGLSGVAPDLSGKRLELLREVVPGLSRVAIVWNPDVRGAVLEYKETETAARSQRLELQSVELFSADDLNRAFSGLSSQRAQAVILSSGNPVAMAQRAEVASLAQRNRLPSIYAIREYVDVGGLLSYGPSIGDMWRRTATYVDKILKGAKPADLPVEQPTKFELVINLTTAKTLGLTIPPSLLRRADDVIR